MNARGAKSVQSIMENVLHKPPEGLLYFAIFGSQVKGTEREDSDLDMMYVTSTGDSLSASVVRRAAKIPGGVKMVTILPYTLESIVEGANVYGSVTYRVLRGKDTRTLYKSPDFYIDLQPGIDYKHSATYWVESAQEFIFPETDCSESRPGRTCYDMHIGTDYLLRACLCMQRTKFPFTRDLRILYNMLSPERRPPINMDLVVSWLRYLEKWDGGKKESDWTRDDAREAKEVTKRAYEFTAGLVGRDALCMKRDLTDDASHTCMVG